MNEETQDPVFGIPEDAETSPDPGPVEPTSPPLIVVPLEDVLDYLNQDDAEPEESADLEESGEVEEAFETLDGDIDLPAVDPTTAVVEQVVEHLLDMIVDLGKIEKHLGEIEKDTNEIQLDVTTVVQTLDHPALTTSFADYTVTEALLLLLLLSAFVSACARMLKGGFSWLRS